jgi:hypothetical protein
LPLCQILDQLEIEDCALLGNSWGGMMGGVFVAPSGLIYRAQRNDFWLRGATRTSFLTIRDRP